MLNEKLENFSKDFYAEINAEAHSQDALKEEVFVEKMGSLLEDYGELEALTTCHYQARGTRVDGYFYDDEFKDITLVTSIFKGQSDSSSKTVTNTEIKTAFKRAINFFRQAKKQFHRKIEVANEAHDLARVIHECRNNIRTLKIVLVTDGITKRRPADIKELEGVKITSVIWDLERAFNFHDTGERENIRVDFSKQSSGVIPCVIHKNSKAPYTTYIGYISGDTLADFYEKWGINMLDMNVRVFLSVRGNVNKEIKKTIITEPEMFCAYNNGITVFAKSVDTIQLNEGIGLLSVEDFQIINGGQTTASLYHARKKDNADLSNISVQMKITVVHDEGKISQLVPRISKFANNQNKVQLADFAANEKPHPELQQISNNLLAPDPTGGSAQTFWFYDRVRGCYEETRNLNAKTPAQKLKFDNLRPKKQKFDKIKLAKAWHSWLRKPSTVSLGGQKNFGYFNSWLADQEEDWESFFKNTVSLVILWNETERIVRRQSFQGYRHNIVTYTITWLVELLDKQHNQLLDLEKIWFNQKLGDTLCSTIEDMAQLVNEHIRDTNLNVTEYCKKQACWDSLKERSFKLPLQIKDELVADKLPDSNITHASIAFVKKLDGETWKNLSTWLKAENFLTAKARKECLSMAKALDSNKKPSYTLSSACHKIWNESINRGYSPTDPKY